MQIKSKTHLTHNEVAEAIRLYIQDRGIEVGENDGVNFEFFNIGDVEVTILDGGI